MENFINHHGIALLLCWFVFSAVVSGMPAPQSNSSVSYNWIYQTLHILSADFSKLISAVVKNKGA